MSQSTAIQPYDDSIQQQSMLPVNTTDDMLIQMWMQTKQSAGTREYYQINVERFLAFLGHKPLQSLTLLDVQAYQQYLESSSYAPSTQRSKLVVAKSLLTFAQKTGYCRFNPGAMLKLPNSTTNRAARIISESEVYKMLYTVEYEKHNHCILHLLYHTGMRLAELCHLKWEHITERENGRGQLFIAHGKGDKARSIVLEQPMYQELLAIKPEHIHKTAPFVFMGYEDKPLSSDQVQRIVRETAALAGIKRRITPHFFRHAHSTHALLRGCPLHVLQATLGHSSLAITGVYTHASPDESSSKYLSI